MNDSDLAFAGVTRQAELVRSGDVTPRELVELYLERIERIGPEVNCFTDVLADSALAEADQAAGRRGSAGEGPLNGVPLAIKDEADIAGLIASHGTSAFEAPARADGELISRLRAAGAIILAKTTLPELAIYGFTESKTFGDTRNPWDTSRTPAGSSGGSAAAVAAGLAPAATASDGAGSIRWPAANCGLFGLKPQRGRVPLAPLPDVWHGLSVKGFLSRSVADTALLLDVAAAGGPTEAHGPPEPDRSFAQAAAQAPGGLRIGWSMKAPRAIAPPIQEEVGWEAVSETIELLRSLGHEVNEVDPGWGPIGNHTAPRYLRAIADDADELVPNHDRLERRTRGFIRMGRLVPDRVLERVMREEAADRERIGRVFERHDVLLTPMLQTQPVKVGRWRGKGALRTLIGMSRVYPMAIPFNHTGQPAASVPAGFDRQGLPRSVQIVGRPADEATLISLAAQIEAERGWTEHRPPLADQAVTRSPAAS